MPAAMMFIPHSALRIPHFLRQFDFQSHAINFQEALFPFHNPAMLRFLLILPLLSAVSPCLALSGDEHWDTLLAPRGVDTSAVAMISDGANIYLGGSYNVLGTTVASRIAKWDGKSWSALGGG